MSTDSTYFLMLSVGFAVSLVSLIAVFVSPKTNGNQFYMGNTNGVDERVVKIVNLVGGDMLSLIPKSVQKKSLSSKEINDVFKESGNPWNVTKMEFLALKAAYGFIMGFVGVLFALIVQPGFALGLIIVLLLSYLGWNKPISTYRKIAKNRSLDFKRHFPEMLDYLTMIMSDGNYTFSNAVEKVLPYLPESAVKDEFSKVTDSINAGVSTEMALNDLSERLPSPALEAFVKAVNNANQLSTPMEGLMKTRAKKSREDLLNDIRAVIQTLPTKTMLTVGPPTIGSMLAIFIVPVVVALLSAI